MDQHAIAQVLRELGTMIELTDRAPKKGIAYRKAAKIVESMENFESIVNARLLDTFPGIGKVLAAMITTLFIKGRHPYYEELLNKVPPSLFELTFISGLGTQKIRTLYERYQVASVLNLKELLLKGEIKGVSNFGPSMQRKVLRNIEKFQQGFSVLYPQALKISEILIGILKKSALRIEVTGTLRRGLELISQVDFLVIPDDKEASLSLFCRHFFVKELLSVTENHAAVRLRQGLIANLYLCSEEDFADKLLETTGSEPHLQELQELAKSRHSFLVKGQTEEAIYEALQIPYIPPELREGMGEIERAREGKFKHLVEFKDLKGTFHCHTIASDGHHTLEEMGEAARQLGWEYLGIADHSKSSYQANGMSEETLLEQINAIRKLNASFPHSFRLFAGIECDILKDGSLDFSNDILENLDYVIVSIHRYFNMEEEEMTRRLIKAIENPFSTIVGHLTGRLLRHRDPYKLNISKVIDACIANQKIIELNAYPSRLDMDWREWIKAADRGLLCSINPDAHSTKDLLNCFDGVHFARKGWLQKQDVINTFSLTKVKNFLN